MPPDQQLVKPFKNQSIAEGGGGIHSENIFEKIISPENLFFAWRRFRSGKGSRADVLAFERNLESTIFQIHRALVSGRWRHGPYTSFTVCDPKPRIIHKASVADRLVHHAIVNVIEPIFDSTFLYDTWSCRIGKGTHNAVLRLTKLLQKESHNSRRPVWVLKCDIRKYFASVDQSILLDLIKHKITDPKALAVLDNIIRSFSKGIPLGNLTSQLCANIYLNPFDHFVAEKVSPLFYLRYCDDFILVHPEHEWLEQKIPILRDYLSDTLRLQLHPNKIHLRPWHWGIDWLGYVLYPDHIRLRPKTRDRLLREIKKNVELYLDQQISYEAIRAVIASYRGCVANSNERDLVKYLDALARSL